MKRGISVSHSQRRRGKNRRVFLSVIYALIVLLLVLSAGILSMQSNFMKIQQVAINDLKYLEEIDIEKGINEILTGKYLFFVSPKRNSFFFPKDEIERYIISFQSVENVSVEREGLQKINIVIKERSPAYIWCASNESAECYFADESGFVFTKAPTITGGLYTRLLGQGGEKAQVGFFYAKEYFRQINEITEFLKRKNSVSAIEYQGHADYVATLEGGVRIMLDLSKPTDKTVSRLNVFFLEPPVSLDDLEYIDARFGNKLFYKTKSGVVGS